MQKLFYFLLIFLTSFVSGQELQKVKLQLQWKHQFEFAGFYAAKEKGYYKDIGLDVEFVEYDGKGNIINNVLEKRADFGLSYSSIVSEYLNNKPIIMIANYFKQSPLVLITHPSIKSPKEIKGKMVMGVSDGIDSITLKLMLEKFGVSTGDILSIPTTFKLDDFINGKVDAMAVFTTNEVYELDKKGIKYNLFNPSVYGVEYYDVNLFTSSVFAKENPTIVHQFKKASIRGWEYALAHQEEIANLILAKYNTQKKSKDALLFEAKQIESLMLSSTEAIGDVNPLRLRLIAQNFIESGFAPRENLHTIDNFVFGAEQSSSNKKEINLLPEEQTYLNNKKSITMCVDPDCEPYEKIDKKGNHKGLAADFIKLIEQKIAKKITLIHTKNWSESLEFAKSGKCEMLSFLNATPNREEFLNFTPTLYTESDVIVAKNSVAYLDGLSPLEEKKVGIVKGYSTDEYIVKNYPKIEIVYIKNYEEGIKMVSDGKLDATINSLFGTAYLIRKLGLVDVKIAGKTELTNEYKIAIIKTEPLLASILSKAVESITQKEKNSIAGNWNSVRFEHGNDYVFMWKVLIAVILIMALLLYREYDIKKINKRLKKEMERTLLEITQKDRMIFQQNKLISMGEMIENIAHQWRQPLAQINASVIKIDDIIYNNNIANKELEQELVDIEETTKYMSQTIDDFRTFFNDPADSCSFYLAEAIQRSLSIIEKNLIYSGIELSLQWDNDVAVKGSMNEFSQVFLIIVNNAKDILLANKIDFPKITITSYQDGDFVTIRICDNGGGVAKENMERIFEPYFTTKHKSQGTGLGLYIAKMIVDGKMKGVLSVENQQDGACFFIKLHTGEMDG